MLIDWPFDIVIYPQESFDEDTGMSAFSVIYTSEGFIVAADGRQSQSDVPLESEKFLISDEVQKIFPISDRDRTLAYVVTGLSRSDDGEFDTHKEAAREVERLSKRRFHDLYSYARNFGFNLNKTIKLARKRNHLTDLTELVKVEELPGAWKITTVLFAGYFHSSPTWVKVVFYHYDHKKIDFLVKVLPVQSGICTFSGSLAIRDLTYPGPNNPNAKVDARFSQYIHPVGHGVSIEGNTKAAEGYIKACSDPIALQIDYEKCSRIGGHIHTAKITPDGFTWLTEPKKRTNL